MRILNFSFALYFLRNFAKIACESNGNLGSGPLESPTVSVRKRRYPMCSVFVFAPIVLPSRKWLGCCCYILKATGSLNS